MYYPEGKSESWIKEDDARGQPKAIDYKNTDITIPLTTQEVIIIIMLFDFG